MFEQSFKLIRSRGTQSLRTRSLRKGFVLPTAAVLFLGGIPIAGLAIDIGTFYLVQSKLQTAVDSAALAGVRSLARGNNSSAQQTAAQNTAIAYVNANFPSGYLGTSGLTVPTPVVDISATNIRTVQVSASVNAPHLFLRWFGGAATTVGAGATAARRDVNVSIVLDRSGSLASSGACGPLKAAAQAFVDKFAEGRDNVGLVTFATSSMLDFPIASDFQSASPNVNSIIGSVNCTGWTNSAQGLWMGYQQLASLNQPASLNVLLFFTDGQPTALTGRFRIKAASGCTIKTDKSAVIASSGSGARGLMDYQARTQPTASDQNLAPNSNGCSYASNFSNVAVDVLDLPNRDFWGNDLSGYLSVVLNSSGTLGVTNGANLLNAATNAADSAASRIRAGDNPGNGAAGLPGVVIFGIGLGGAGAASDEFMLRVTNDPASPIYSTASPAGLYIYAPTSADLGRAFTRVTAEVLRLAQ